MAITFFTEDLNIIQKLDDQPNDVGGLSADELKQKFDESGNKIKDFLNNSLIPELDEAFSDAMTTAKIDEIVEGDDK